MKVFVPYFSGCTAESALDDAALVPYEQGYNLLHVERVRKPSSELALGQAEIIPPADWPRNSAACQSLPQTSVYRATMSS